MRSSCDVCYQNRSSEKLLNEPNCLINNILCRVCAHVVVVVFSGVTAILRCTGLFYRGRNAIIAFGTIFLLDIQCLHMQSNYEDLKLMHKMSMTFISSLTAHF